MKILKLRAYRYCFLGVRIFFTISTCEILYSYRNPFAKLISDTSDLERFDLYSNDEDCVSHSLVLIKEK
jgi:hypothetical protein